MMLITKHQELLTTIMNYHPSMLFMSFQCSFHSLLSYLDKQQLYLRVLTPAMGTHRWWDGVWLLICTKELVEAMSLWCFMQWHWVQIRIFPIRTIADEHRWYKRSWVYVFLFLTFPVREKRLFVLFSDLLPQLSFSWQTTPKSIWRIIAGKHHCTTQRSSLKKAEGTFVF